MQKNLKANYNAQKPWYEKMGYCLRYECDSPKKQKLLLIINTYIISVAMVLCIQAKANGA